MEKAREMEKLILYNLNKMETKNETNQTIIPGTSNQIDNIDFGAVLRLTSKLVEENEKIIQAYQRDLQVIKNLTINQKENVDMFKTPQCIQQNTDETKESDSGFISRMFDSLNFGEAFTPSTSLEEIEAMDNAEDLYTPGKTGNSSFPIKETIHGLVLEIQKILKKMQFYWVHNICLGCTAW